MGGRSNLDGGTLSNLDGGGRSILMGDASPLQFKYWLLLNVNRQSLLSNPWLGKLMEKLDSLTASFFNKLHISVKVHSLFSALINEVPKIR